MSAWYVLSALGLYPLHVGSDRWAVGTPLFARAVVHHPSGDLEIVASGEGPYVHGLIVGGRAVPGPVLRHAELLGGATLTFATGSTPSSWGSTVEEADVPVPWRDATGGPHAGGWHGAAGPVPGLSDDDLSSAVDLTAALGDGDALTWSGDGGVLVAYTLTSALDGTDAPSAWHVEARDAAGTWRRVDERAGESFTWPGQLRPFVLAVPVRTSEVRVVLSEPRGSLAQIELLVDPARG
jgi:hypothetical protein